MRKAVGVWAVALMVAFARPAAATDGHLVGSGTWQVMTFPDDTEGTWSLDVTQVGSSISGTYTQIETGRAGVPVSPVPFSMVITGGDIAGTMYGNFYSNGGY